MAASAEESKRPTANSRLSPLSMTLASGPYHGQTIRMDGNSAVVTVQVEETTI